MTPPRCRSTLRYDTTWHTRCLRESDPVHTRHVGNDHPGGYGKRRWREGDPASYQSDRPETEAWEVPPP